jgi:hypothetical protein
MNRIRIDKGRARPRATLALLFLGVALVAHPAPAAAQRKPRAEPPARRGEVVRKNDPAALRRRVVQLEDRVTALEAELAELRAMLRAETAARMRSSASASAPRRGEAAFLDREGWRERESWRRLRHGIGEVEVVQLLGEPGRIVEEETFTVWYYPDVGGGSVRFTREGRRVEAWREP